MLMPPEEPKESEETAEETAIGQPEVSWTASEFVHHEKSLGWYFGLAIGAAILAFFIYLLTEDVISVVVVIMAAVVLGIYGSHHPRQLHYKLNGHSLTIGGKQYDYGGFKSFSVVPEGAFSGIVFMPLKRFAPPLTIYYAPEDQDKIMAVLSTALPYEEPRRDVVDNFMRRIRF